ncbi:MAG TPA: YeeE/YedE family protein [Burkholderiales bacterium]|nr:YeeE/YedE family protein [Burkholderiales bacterium]
MKRAAVALVCGFVFGAGLIISQMINPAKVIGFLDITGKWDPSLALVMGGAVAVFGVLYRLALRQATPLFAPRFSLPDKEDLEASLVVGALIFGVGWGLGGFCPGPAIVSAAFGDARVWAFVGAMIAGMLVYRVGLRRTHE